MRISSQLDKNAKTIDVQIYGGNVTLKALFCYRVIKK